MLPLVIYNGRQRWARAQPLSELVEPLPDELRGLQPEVSFLLLDESSFSDEELAARRNLVASLFRLENSLRPEEIESRLEPLNEQLSATGNAHVERAFDVWLERLVRLRFPVLNIGEIRGREGRTMLAERMGEWIEESEQREQRGLEEGRRVSRRALEIVQRLVIHQLEQRFSVVPDSIAGEIRAMTDLQRLGELGERVLVVDSIDDLGLG